jgi:hypothetical protein
MRVSPSLAEKIGGWCHFSLSYVERLPMMPYRACFPIPHRKGWETKPFSLSHAEGLTTKPYCACFAIPRRKGWVTTPFSLSHAKRVTTKPYCARFAISHRKGWGTVPFFTKSRRGANNEALLHVFCHPSPKKLGDCANFH